MFLTKEWPSPPWDLAEYRAQEGLPLSGGRRMGELSPTSQLGDTRGHIQTIFPLWRGEMGKSLKTTENNLVVNRNDQINFYLEFLLGIPVKGQKQIVFQAALCEQVVILLSSCSFYQAYAKKMHMNKCIVSLRDLKVAVIEEIQCLVQELKNIQSTLHVSKHIPIPQIPQIYPEEVPEKRFQYDEETLLAFKRQQMKNQPETAPQVEQAASAGSAGSFLRLSSGKDGDLTARDSLSRSSKASVFNLDIPKFMEFERTDPTEVELEIMKRDEIKHLYMQQYLINRVRNETAYLKLKERRAG